MKTNHCAGYSLVEISLALLVAAIGIMAAFGLFPDGLSSSRKAIEATEVRSFAEFVFASLAFDASNITNEWNNDFPPGDKLMWSHALAKPGSVADQLQVIVSSAPQPYFWKPNYWHSSGSYKATYFTYTLTIGEGLSGPPSKYARLEVWPGEYAIPPANEGFVFYREYLPPR